MARLRERLERARLLKPEASPETGRPDFNLLRWCDEGALVGGLSVALDVRPDELIGPLCAAIGGGAKTLKVLDVRDRPELELTIGFGGFPERWAVSDAAALVHNLNDLLRADPGAKPVAVLGEWQDALQLWCVPRAILAGLLQERVFDPRNRSDLVREGDGGDRD